MSSKTNPIETFLEQIISREFQRIIRGNYNYSEDMQKLQNLRKKAHEIESIQLESRVINCMAALNILTGQLNIAEAMHWENFHLLESQGLRFNMAAPLSNIAVIERLRGNFFRAIGHYESGLALLDKIDTATARTYMALSVGKMACLNALYRFSEARRLFETLDQQANELVALDPKEFARVMIEGRNNRAVIAVIEMDAEEANFQAKLAMEHAMQLGLDSETGLTHFILGLIHLVIEQQENLAENCFSAAAERLQVAAPMSAIDSYQLQARLLFYLGYEKIAEDYQAKAQNIMQSAGIAAIS